MSAQKLWFSRLKDDTKIPALESEWSRHTQTESIWIGITEEMQNSTGSREYDHQPLINLQTRTF